MEELYKTSPCHIEPKCNALKLILHSKLNQVTSHRGTELVIQIRRGIDRQQIRQYCTVLDTRDLLAIRYVLPIAFIT